jgi:hypothetical protein
MKPPSTTHRPIKALAAARIRAPATVTNKTVVDRADMGGAIDGACNIDRAVIAH